MFSATKNPNKDGQVDSNYQENSEDGPVSSFGDVQLDDSLAGRLMSSDPTPTPTGSQGFSDISSISAGPSTDISEEIQELQRNFQAYKEVP